jgi:hypothetical protein
MIKYRMKNSIILCFATVLSLSLYGQNKSNKPVPNSPSPTSTYNATMRGKFGISDVQLIEKYLVTVEGVGISAKDVLMEQNLKAYMMPPRKMGEVNNSACYALASALEFYTNLNNNYKDNLSPDYIKLNLPQTNIEDGLAFLATNGTVSAAILPFESQNLTPSVNAAMKIKIKNYLKLFQPTTRPQQKLYDLRKAITRGNPVIVEMQITNEFKTLKQTRLWKPSEGDKTPAGVQYLVAVGFDEEKRAIELQNSVGREWGNGGYIWISYDDFSILASNGYVLLP